jgi:hypothetical protein
MVCLRSASETTVVAGSLSARSSLSKRAFEEESSVTAEEMSPAESRFMMTMRASLGFRRRHGAGGKRDFAPFMLHLA